MSESDEGFGALQVYEPEPGQHYTVDAAAYLAGVSRRAFLLYCRSGLIMQVDGAPYGALLFDDAAISTVRRAETLRKTHRMDLAGVRMVFEMMRQMELLRQELRFLRGT